MKFLITGAMGYIGTALRNEMDKRKIKYLVYDLVNDQDILNKEQLAEYSSGHQAIVHLAAIPYGVTGRQWEDYFLINVEGTQRVAEVAAENMAIRRMVYVSSTAYYGAQVGFPFSVNGDVTELDSNAIQNYLDKEMPDMNGTRRAELSYACSKIAGETIMAAYGMGGRVQAVVMRLAPVFPDDSVYEWGLALNINRAAQALTQAAVMPLKGGYHVFNVADGGAISTERWEAACLNS